MALRYTLRLSRVEKRMFAGSLVALVTPMQGDGRVDYDSLRRLVDFHVREGTDGIVSVGTTGESATLDFDEHIEVIRRAARAAGAQACLLVTPYYNKPTQEGLYRHYRAVAEAVEIPQILYNVPGRTGVDMLPETVQRLAGTPNVIGLKEARGELPRIRELLDRVGERMHVYSGDDATACESILMGCKGDISVTANIAPRLMHEMCAAALAGDRALAQALDAKLQPLHKNLFVEPNPIPVKWALGQMGLIPEGIRLPLTPLATQYHAPVRAALAAAGALS
jgi:4-hydroxy-tetrahydrodipicolinate synthase